MEFQKALVLLVIQAKSLCLIDSCELFIKTNFISGLGFGEINQSSFLKARERLGLGHVQVWLFKVLHVHLVFLSNLFFLDLFKFCRRLSVKFMFIDS